MEPADSLQGKRRRRLAVPGISCGELIGMLSSLSPTACLTAPVASKVLIISEMTVSPGALILTPGICIKTLIINV